MPRCVSVWYSSSSACGVSIGSEATGTNCDAGSELFNRPRTSASASPSRPVKNAITSASSPSSIASR